MKISVRQEVCVLAALTVLGALVSAIACGDNVPPDDGFGVPCEVSFDGRLFTTCASSLGEEGLCYQLETGEPAGVCRRWCDGDETDPRACPEGQVAIPVVANRCYCEPSP